MGNLTYIIPMVKHEDMCIEKVFVLLAKRFDNFHFDMDMKYETITVRLKCDIKKYNDFIMSLYFNEPNDLIRFVEDITYLKNEKGYDTEGLVKDLEILKNTNPDLNINIQSTYGHYTDYKNDIDFFLRDYFKGYIFDEGIHPEFIPPSYVRKIKKKKTLLQSIGLLLGFK